MSNRVLELFRSAVVSVERFDHPADEDHVDPEEERAGGFAVNFIEGGTFEIHVGGAAFPASSRVLFCTAPGLAYRCLHPPGVASDSCLTVSFGPDAHDDACEDRSWPPLRGQPLVPLDNRRAYVKKRLLSSMAGSSLELEAVAGEVLDSAADRGGPRRALYRESQLTWYARRVDRARERLDTEYDRDHSLAALSREAGMSPFHFARVFSELVGVPPHRYLVGRRLDAAERLLREGMSVTETCFACGFTNLSHFVRSFRARQGRSPSALRRTASD